MRHTVELSDLIGQLDVSEHLLGGGLVYDGLEPASDVGVRLAERAIEHVLERAS